jgi:dynein heavy chain
MGPKFLIPPEFDLEASYNDSSSGTPVIFIMPGNDPLKQLSDFCLLKRKTQLKSISLG